MEYACNKCTETFTSDSTLQEHIGYHDGEEPHKCNVCNKTFASFDYLKQHAFSHQGNGNKPFKCRYCDEDFMEAVYLEAHVRKHTGERPYACHFCHKCFIEEKYLKLHLKDHLDDEESGDNQFKWNSEFNKDGILGEKTDDYLEASNQDFKVEERQNEESSNDSQEDSNSKEEEKELLTFPANLDSIRCDLCDVSFRGKAGLKAHQRFCKTITIDDNCTTCQYCSANFETSRIVKQHIMSALKEQTCCACKKKFKKGSLFDHFRVHIGKRCYQCPKCDKAFIVASALRIHMRRHDEEKKYKCLICEKAFHFAHKLKRHIEIHNDKKLRKKPWKCMHCGRCYYEKYERDRHAKRKHGTNATPTKIDSKAKKASAAFHQNADKGINLTLISHFDVPVDDSDIKKRKHDVLRVKIERDSLESKSCSEQGIGDVKKELDSPMLEDCHDDYDDSLTQECFDYGLGEKLYNCQSCGMKFHSQQLLKEHTTNWSCCADVPLTKDGFHSTEMMSDVSINEVGSSNVMDVRESEHFSMSTVANTFQCQLCDHISRTPLDFTNHQSFCEQIVEDHGGTTCKFCKTSFETDKLLRKHVVSYKTIKTCCECNKSMRNVVDLRSHMRIHSGEKPYQCSQCGKTFTAASSLRSHLKMHQGEKPFKCPICSKDFRTKGHLNRHMDIHEDDESRRQKQWKCEICDTFLMTKESRDRHMKYKHGDKVHPCPTCGMLFPSQDYVNRHMRNHTNTRTHICPVCNSSFKTKPVLKKHILTHSDDKPYKCDQCKFSCSDNWGLQNHIKVVHEGERKFICSICGQAFGYNTKLVNHMRTHTGEKPYKCQFCDQAFVDSSGLIHHRKKHL